jgi:hypothetical protein
MSQAKKEGTPLAKATPQESCKATLAQRGDSVNGSANGHCGQFHPEKDLAIIGLGHNGVIEQERFDPRRDDSPKYIRGGYQNWNFNTDFRGRSPWQRVRDKALGIDSPGIPRKKPPIVADFSPDDRESHELTRTGKNGTSIFELSHENTCEGTHIDYSGGTETNSHKIHPSMERLCDKLPQVDYQKRKANKAAPVTLSEALDALRKQERKIAVEVAKARLDQFLPNTQHAGLAGALSSEIGILITRVSDISKKDKRKLVAAQQRVTGKFYGIKAKAERDSAFRFSVKEAVHLNVLLNIVEEARERLEEVQANKNKEAGHEQR